MTTNLVASNDRNLFLHGSGAQPSKASIPVLKSTCWLGHTPSGGAREDSVPCLSQLLAATSTGTPWLMVMSFQSASILTSPSPLCASV